MAREYASRWRVKKEEVLAEGQAGPIRAKLIAQNEALGLFSVRDRRAILLAAAQRMGDFWLAVFLPKRFDANYAAAHLGYRVRPSYADKKARIMQSPQPLVWRGDLMDAINDAEATGRAGPNGPSVTIRLPMPSHRLAPVVQSELRTIPPSEIRAMAVELEKKILSLIKGAEDAEPDRKRLTPSQRAGMAVKQANGRLVRNTTGGRPQRARPPGWGSAR